MPEVTEKLANSPRPNHQAAGSASLGEPDSGTTDSERFDGDLCDAAVASHTASHGCQERVSAYWIRP